jgi:putative oxidoreductase
MSQTASASLHAGSHRALRASLWIVQLLVGVAFIAAGLNHATQPMDVLATKMPWTVVVGAGLTRFIGASEFLGGLGLILPSLTRIQPRLTPLAAAGLTTVMVFASVFHLVRLELSVLPVNVVLGGLAAFVAWGRGKKAPISPR